MPVGDSVNGSSVCDDRSSEQRCKGYLEGVTDRNCGFREEKERGKEGIQDDRFQPGLCHCPSPSPEGKRNKQSWQSCVRKCLVPHICRTQYQRTNESSLHMPECMEVRKLADHFEDQFQCKNSGTPCCLPLGGCD